MSRMNYKKLVRNVYPNAFICKDIHSYYYSDGTDNLETNAEQYCIATSEKPHEKTVVELDYPEVSFMGVCSVGDWTRRRQDVWKLSWINVQERAIKLLSE